ncbi:uncharacterized protein BO66DRAFT_438249 [Aspergillus aculeatinus CBS 121060]|uniref:Uncharacterized protein n=1 Tax=Aspergillus aculeatinus CBS 121060 TaxID=1448322 RepID=A0ACD1H9T7_9EURO|nr:hypothetical protein BO66DRAFT_438249 [Aspergillus aculeatinus CBS 121060]RAH70244.1 hypothetical protein BO66DRAFT_438249 [Aspergillus aculeatinus CBS 121060]
MKPTSLASVFALLATAALALPTETEENHLEARVLQPQVYGRTCYCGDNCNTVSWLYAWEWSDGACFNFYTGMSAAWIDAGSACTFYNAANCQGSYMASSSTCTNSNVGWLWSARCRR